MVRKARIELQCLNCTAITLLTLLAVRRLVIIIACNVQLQLYSPYGPYSLFRNSVRVQ